MAFTATAAWLRKKSRCRRSTQYPKISKGPKSKGCQHDVNMQRDDIILPLFQFHPFSSNVSIGTSVSSARVSSAVPCITKCCSLKAPKWHKVSQGAHLGPKPSVSSEGFHSGLDSHCDRPHGNVWKCARFLLWFRSMGLSGATMYGSWQVCLSQVNIMHSLV